MYYNYITTRLVQKAMSTAEDGGDRQVVVPETGRARQQPVVLKPEDLPENVVGKPPTSLSSKVFSTLSSDSFWSQAKTLEFWEQGCLGRSMAIGSIVGLAAGAHRYRSARSLLKSMDRALLGVLFGTSLSYMQCRQTMLRIQETLSGDASKQPRASS